MNRERRLGLALLAGAIFIILAAIAVVVTRESNALYYTVVFKDAEQLQAGDRVSINGVNIGTVKWLQLFERPARIQVRLRIDPQYASYVHAESTAIIRGVAFPNVGGQKIVDIVNADNDAPAPMPRNAIIDGVNNDVELVAWKVRHNYLKGGGDKLKGFFGGLKDQIGGLSEDLRELSANPKVRAALDQLRGAIDLLQTKGRAAVAQVKEKWPQIKAQIGPVLKQLEETGKRHAAEVIRQAMDWIEKTLNDWRAPAPGPATTPAANKVI